MILSTHYTHPVSNQSQDCKNYNQRKLTELKKSDFKFNTFTFYMKTNPYDKIKGCNF